MPSPATIRHLRYASGYLNLGMLTEASNELEAIEGYDRLADEVLVLRSNLYTQARQWDLLAAVARELARRSPDYEQAWLDWSHALREMDRVADAKAVLVEAEQWHGKSGSLHFNLACYHSLLGELDEARKRLRRACRKGRKWKEAAFANPDLKALWDGFEPKAPQ